MIDLFDTTDVEKRLLQTGWSKDEARLMATALDLFAAVNGQSVLPPDKADTLAQYVLSKAMPEEVVKEIVNLSENLGNN